MRTIFTGIDRHWRTQTKKIRLEKAADSSHSYDTFAKCCRAWNKKSWLCSDQCSLFNFILHSVTAPSSAASEICTPVSVRTVKHLSCHPRLYKFPLIGASVNLRPTVEEGYQIDVAATVLSHYLTNSTRDRNIENAQINSSCKLYCFNK